MANKLVLGPKTRAQLAHFAAVWKQGDHVLVHGATGSGKTRLARELLQIRLNAGGRVVVFVSKLLPDETIEQDYAGWTRWKTWSRRPHYSEDRILLWPDVQGRAQSEAIPLMRQVFGHAIDEISKVGKWCVQWDEGLIMASPSYLNFGSQMGIMYAMMRSAKGTLLTLAQRPSHLPLALYANASQVFTGAVQEHSDMKRLANLDGVSSRQLRDKMAGFGKHDFLWIPVSHPEIPSQRVNLVE